MTVISGGETENEKLPRRIFSPTVAVCWPLTPFTVMLNESVVVTEVRPLTVRVLV